MIILDTGGGSEFDNDGKGRGNIPTNGETAGETAAFERAFELGISDFPEDFVAVRVGGGLDTVCGANFLADFTPFFPGFFPTVVPPVVPLFTLFLGEISFSPFLRFIPLAGFSGLSLAITINIAQFTSVEKQIQPKYNVTELNILQLLLSLAKIYQGKAAFTHTT